MTQLRYFTTALVLLVGCTTEVPASDPASATDDTVTSEPDQAGAAARTAPHTGSGDVRKRDDCEPLPRQGEPCPDRVCAEGLTCLEYYGIAGPAGGLFTSCEIPCRTDDECPRSQTCIVIADGPGQVCRPRYL